MQEQINSNAIEFQRQIYTKFINNFERDTNKWQIAQDIVEISDFGNKISYVEGLLESQNLIPDFSKLQQKKDGIKSEKYRSEGNKCYQDQNFIDALEFYNRR
jgi:hypothetical protein